ncbi:helix-turn-helix transcriptional regulator [Insolitispirillum peregrinum]|uniref:helix-turn-helix transcriptional regulator n=1 Tax=Insolitispirillum peregrinum TaxID=80876 RepID=UPI00360ACD52
MIRDLSVARTGVPIQDLRDRYGVTRRTIERDLAAIEAAGYTVETLASPEPGTVRKRIQAGSGGLILPVTAEELAAARAGVIALERGAPPTVAAALRMLVTRLEESQAMAVAVDAEALAEAQGFVLNPGPLPATDATVVETLRLAILRCEQVRVTYRKGGGELARVYLAEPYGLLYGAKGYLVWRGVDDRKWRKFALPHIDRIELAGASFQRDPHFVLADFIADAFGVSREEPFTVVLRIQPDGMPRLRQHRFHPTQVVEPHPDGGATVRFTASGLTEISWHLFTWGSKVRILAPEELRAAYRHLLADATSTLNF